METYKFVEPHHTGGNAIIYITKAQIISFMREKYTARDKYPVDVSDETLLSDFILVNWAFEIKEDK